MYIRYFVKFNSTLNLQMFAPLSYSINQSINQPINQLINQSVNQPINQSINATSSESKIVHHVLLRQFLFKHSLAVPVVSHLYHSSAPFSEFSSIYLP